MESKDRANVYMVSIICVNVIWLILGCFILHNRRIKIFVENGYTQQTLQGETGSEWVLPDKSFRILPGEK